MDIGTALSRPDLAEALLAKLLWLIGTTVGGWVGWWLGSLFGGFLPAFFLSLVGTAAGLYWARRVAAEYF